MGLNLAAGTVGTAFDLMVVSADLYIIFFVCMLGALVFVISMAGGSKAYGKWAATKIRSRKLSLAATALLGPMLPQCVGRFQHRSCYKSFPPIPSHDHCHHSAHSQGLRWS